MIQLAVASLVEAVTLGRPARGFDGRGGVVAGVVVAAGEADDIAVVAEDDAGHDPFSFFIRHTGVPSTRPTEAGPLLRRGRVSGTAWAPKDRSCTAVAASRRG